MNLTTWPTSGPFHRRRTAIDVRAMDRPWLRSLSLLTIIGLLSWLGFAQLRTPSVIPATSPPASFSAERAMVHLNAIAGQSRAVGMPGHDAARDYLVAQLTAMGLQPELQTTTSVLRFEGADSFGTGMVTNVIARIPGTANTGAIAINAHYDGGATGPAAGDNGVGVAATLEVVRAVLAGPPLANDVIVVFSDGEENGDLGAAAFNQQHPWAKDVRLAINFEAQGTGGPAMLYATSDEDGWLTGEYLSVAPDPSAYSMLPELVRALPGMRLACDLEDYLLNGAAGLGFVLAEGTAHYHTAQDNVANIDQGSLQQEGGNTLAGVRHFGAKDLTTVPTQANRVYFVMLPGVVVHYSSSWAVPLALLVTVVVGAVIGLGYRRRMLSVRGLVVGSHRPLRRHARYGGPRRAALVRDQGDQCRLASAAGGSISGARHCPRVDVDDVRDHGGAIRPAAEAYQGQEPDGRRDAGLDVVDVGHCPGCAGSELLPDMAAPVRCDSTRVECPGARS